MSPGHPGSRNDKTIVRTDEFVTRLKDKEILEDVEYTLYKIRSLAHYVIVDYFMVLL